MDVHDEFTRPYLDRHGKLIRELAQGYVSIRAFDPITRKTIKRWQGHNTVVNDARRSAAAAFANIPGNVGLGFNANLYRMGYSNVQGTEWDSVNNKPNEVPFTDNALLPQYDGVLTVDYFHTQASVSGLSANGWQWQGVGQPLIPAAIALGIDYPFNSDEYAVRLYVELDGNTSVGATFDTVEVVTLNGVKFAARWTYPIVKQPNWGLAIEHLVLF